MGLIMKESRKVLTVYQNGEGIRVYRNPSREQVEALKRRVPVIRTFWDDDGNCYAWDGYTLTHSYMRKLLRVPAPTYACDDIDGFSQSLEQALEACGFAIIDKEQAA